MRAGLAGLALGTFQTFLVKQDGSLWGTGVDPDSRSKKINFAPVLSEGAKAAAVGNHFTIVLAQNGTVWVLGNIIMVHDMKQATRERPSITTHFLDGAKALAAGGYHSLILTRQGEVFGIGWNKYGQLGDELMDTKDKLTMIYGGAKAVAAGDIHSIVLKQDGSVWASGRNYNGQLGDGSKIDRGGFVQALCGDVTSDTDEDGDGDEDGDEDGDIFGDEDGDEDRDIFGDVLILNPMNGVTDIYSGGNSYHSMALKEDGSVWGTGWNEFGQLGDGTTTDRSHYVQVVLRSDPWC